MAQQIDYHAGARLDFDEAFDWYAERSSGAALGFVAAVDEALERVSLNPGRFPKTLAGCRYCSLKKYPFRIVFRPEAHRLVVIAIAHAKRRPGYWRRRV